jgi:hypothetical protein
MSEKHFLDTSILRLKIHGISKYKEYLNSQFGSDNLYVSKYVKMEFNRSFLCNIIDFYFTLHMPSYKTISDAMAVWSDKFKASQLKAIIQFTGMLFSSNELNLNDAKDKAKALRILESYIKRIALVTQSDFKDIGTDSTRCGLANLILHCSCDNKAYDDIRKFKEHFDDKNRHQNKCSIGYFFKQRFISQVKMYIDRADKISSPGSNSNRGFVNIASKLKLILNGDEQCSCKMCERIGDCVIALEMPLSMQMETVDYSYEHLCPPLNKKYYRHPSQQKLMASDSGT